MRLSSHVWNPTKTNGLVLWLAHNTGVTDDDGVQHWQTNISGSTTRFSQGTVDNRPTLSSDLGVDFDGGDFLTGGQVTLTDEFVVGVKFKVEDQNASNDVVIGDQSTANNFIRLNDGDTIGVKTSGAQKTINLDSTVFNQNDVASLVVTRDSSDLLEVWVNGVKQSNSATSAGDFLIDGLGCRNSGGTVTNFFTGVIYEVVIFDTEHTDELPLQVSNHLQSIKL